MGAELESSSTVIHVVAAAIFDRQGRVLLQQMLPGKRHAGLWEFPGGKIEGDENQELALVREIAEELTVELDAARLELLGEAREAAGSGHPAIVMALYRSRDWRGSPASVEGQQWGWFTLAEAGALPMPPMDRALLARLAQD